MGLLKILPFTKLIVISSLCLALFSCNRNDDPPADPLPEELTIYPNPADVKVVITTRGTGNIQIMDVVGRLVLNQPSKGTDTINVTNFIKGLYTVKFNSKSQKLVVK